MRSIENPWAVSFDLDRKPHYKWLRQQMALMKNMKIVYIIYIYYIYILYRKTLDALAAFHHPEGFLVVCLKNRVPLNPLVNHHIPYWKSYFGVILDSQTNPSTVSCCWIYIYNLHIYIYMYIYIFPLYPPFSLIISPYISCFLSPSYPPYILLYPLIWMVWNRTPTYQQPRYPLRNFAWQTPWANL